MGETVEVTKIRIEKAQGKDKKAYIEDFPEPVVYGLRGGVKKFFGVKTGDDLPTTLDHLAATVASCMTGSLGSALEARGIPSYPAKLSADVEGHIENVEGKPLLTRIHVKYHVKIPKGKKAEAQRAVDHHEKVCAASQSVRRGFQIEFEAEIEEE
jgi:uncharacterized OsmC-like protein